MGLGSQNIPQVAGCSGYGEAFAAGGIPLADIGAFKELKGINDRNTVLQPCQRTHSRFPVEDHSFVDIFWPDIGGLDTG